MNCPDCGVTMEMISGLMVCPDCDMMNKTIEEKPWTQGEEDDCSRDETEASKAC